MKLSKIDNQIIQTLCEKAKVKLHKWNGKKSSGCAMLSRRIIKISTHHNKNKTRFISTFLHELTHFYALDNGIYSAYHKGISEKQSFKRTALKAERWVDNWAAQLCKKFFPEIKYSNNYNGKYGKNWLYENFGWKTK